MKKNIGVASMIGALLVLLVAMAGYVSIVDKGVDGKSARARRLYDATTDLKRIYFDELDKVDWKNASESDVFILRERLRKDGLLVDRGFGGEFEFSPDLLKIMKERDSDSRRIIMSTHYSTDDHKRVVLYSDGQAGCSEDEGISTTK